MAETVRIEIPIETIDNTDPELSNITKNFEKMEKAADGANSSAKKANQTVSQFDKQAQKTEKSLARWAKEKYEIFLEAKDKISPILSTVGNGLRNVTGKTWSVTMRAIDLITSPVRGIINLLKNPIFQAGAVLGVSISLAGTINTYKDFEAAMSQVQAISGSTESELGKLTDKAKEMGATTKFTAEESAEAFNYMAMAGWKTENMLDGIEGILSLAAASGEDLATTSDIVTDALTAFGLAASDSGHFADVLAQASANANTNVSMLGESFKYVAPVAGAMKYNVEDVSLALGLMANSSVKGSMAGTALKTALANMAAPTDNMATAMNKYGISLTDSRGNMKTLKEVMDNLRSSLGGLAEAEQTAAASTIFGKEAMAGMLSVINASEEDYNKLANAINNADGAAANMSDTMLDNLEGSITLLQSAVDGVKISFGERLSPYVRSLADWLTEQMPEVEEGLSEMMDWVDNKVDRMKRKFKEISGTQEWQNADFLGKAKISWDEFIAEPFKEWWNSTGKAKFADFAQDIGEGIGTGLKVGVMTMLGIDLGETLDEGVSIGASFARGFSEGFDFDVVSEKLWQGFGNMLSSAGKLLPGGASADLSSVMSAVMLSKIAFPFINMGKGAFNIGKTIFGKNSTTGISLASSLIGSTGNAMVSGSGLLGSLANVGYAMNPGNTAGLYFGSTAGMMSGGAAALSGAGVVAGGAAAGATLISAGIDVYKAIKSDDKAEKSAYASSAGLKVGGVATGAAIGTLILPGIGTAIGAGIGGIAGWIAGNKVKESYEEELEEAQKAAEKAQKVYETTGLSVDKVRFANEDLNEALNDTNLSAEELANYIQEDMAKVAEAAFGDITLSLAEIKDLAQEITFGKSIESVTEFAKASETVSTDLASLKSTISTLKKENWKASLGMELDETERDNYKKAIDNFTESAKQYIEDNHYRATVALKLINGDGADTNGLDNMYSGMKSQIDDVTAQLSDKVTIALQDGVIDLNEQDEILNLQQQIEDITSKLSSAQEEASLDVLKIKYGNGSFLSIDSFNQMQEELKAQVESWTENYDSALEVTLTNLHLQYPDGGEEFKAEVANATGNYTAQMDEMNVRVQKFNLEAIAGAWDEQLNGILPDLEGSLSEKLQTAMNNALLEKPDVSMWTQEDVMKWFDLDGIDTSAFENIYAELKATAEQIPQSDVIDAMAEGGRACSDAAVAGITSEFANALSGSSQTFRTAAQDTFTGAFANPIDVSAQVNIKPTYSVSGSVSNAINSVFSTVNGMVTNVRAGTHASGGFVSGGPQLSWLAEEGWGEFVIPTNPSRRARALDLYEQAGAALGVQAHAEGGYISGSNSASNMTDYNLFSEAIKNAPIGSYEATEGNAEDNPTVYEPVSVQPEQSGGNSISVPVSVSVSPQFVIEGSGGKSEEDIMAIIRKNMKAMADELGGEIADRLEAVFSNMPTVKEA